MIAAPRHGRAVIGAAVAALIGAAVACDVPPTATVSRASMSSPSAAASPAVSPTSDASAESVELRYLDPRHVPAVSSISSHGEILWAAGEPFPSEIWRFVPGANEPVLLFTSPDEDANITDVIASAAGYAFVELTDDAFGKGGWRVWYLPAGAAQPIEIDRGLAPHAGAAPTIALDDRHLAWASFVEPAAGPRSRLRVAPLGDPTAISTLLDAPIEERLLWYPALNGDELWYGTIHGDLQATGVGDEYHLETVDLADPGSPPVRFPGIADDFNPAVDDAYVVWKTNVHGDNANSWGTLHVLDRGTSRTATIPVPNANRPSLGSRYVAFDEITHRRLTVYDLMTGKVIELDRLASAGATFGGASVSENLLTFFSHTGTAPPQIGWAVLPE